jgi:hypothetical protein
VTHGSSGSTADRVGAPAAWPGVGRKTYAGLFLVTAATLMQEVLLTRIFSVTMWYHFAFVAVSLAMFGLTVGALLVYLRPNVLAGSRLRSEIANAALFFSISAVVSILVHLNVPVRMDFSAGGLASLAFNYLLMAAPFFFSGVCVCGVLTGFTERISALYAADLTGAALGCLAVLYSLMAIGVAGSVFAVGLLGAMAAWFFAADAGLVLLRRKVAVLCGALLLLLAGNAISALHGHPLFRLRWAKGGLEVPPLFEKWNSFSRVAVWGDPNHPMDPASEGTSSTYKPGKPVRILVLTIDDSAATDLTNFGGDWSRLDYLQYNVNSLCFWLRPHGKVFIIGAGGGRDVLSAKFFGAKSVRALEVNPAVLDALLHRFGDFSGHLDRLPGVTFVNDEARSYIARDQEKYDVIEASLVDTWAATAAGAFTLTENSLYTVEAWDLFLGRLTPHGILSFSRWYIPAMPGEVYRLTTLAAASLRNRGVRNPQEHIVILSNPPRGGQQDTATILVSPAPFSELDLARIEQIAARMKFEILVSPHTPSNPIFAELAKGDYRGGPAASLPLNLSPPTDESPFFFNMVSFGEAVRSRSWNSVGNLAGHLQGVHVLAALLAVVVALTFLCIVLPLFRAGEKRMPACAVPHLVFFLAIGLGFMLVEVSAMERLIVLLGVPTYALSVVLFVLLLASGVGSYSTRGSEVPGGGRAAMFRLIFLLVVLGVCGVAGPRLTTTFEASSTPERVLVATVWLFPMGVFMGMAFPLGFKLAAGRSPNLTPWLWGINGAASVCASVLAVVIAMAATISAAFWTGFGCYVLATAAFGVALVSRARLPEFAHELAPEKQVQINS